MTFDRSAVRSYVRTCMVFVWLGLSCLPRSCAAETVEIAGATMGTSYSVKIGSRTADEAPLDTIDAPADLPPKIYLANKIADRVGKIDARMSNYKVDSDISRFNQSPGNEWFPVAEETAFVVRKALEISNETGGAFDITVGPLVRLWNFGPGSRSSRSIPSDREIEMAKSKTGYEKIEARANPPALRKMISALEIDLSGIAKGYAVDQVALLLESENVMDYLVEIGGEIRTSGQRRPSSSKESQWIVGIESPQSNTRAIANTLPLVNKAMASSGDYRNFFEIDGIRYSHTIDPRTGRPVHHEFAAVTVLSDDCTTADAIATSLLVMGNRAKAFAERSQIQALFFERENRAEDRFLLHRTSTFPPVQTFPDTAALAGAATETSFWRLLAASIIVIGLALMAMAIGVIFSNRCIKGSCGGMEGLTDEHGRPLCEGCSTPSAECTTDPSLREHFDSQQARP